MTRHFFLLPALLSLAVSGCDRPVANYQQQFLLSEQPSGGKTVIEIRDALLSGDDADQQTVTVVGEIGGMPNPYGDEQQPDFPWREEEATFFLVDPTTVAEFGDHGHAEGEECSFCLAKARSLVSTVAFVQFRDEAGNLLPFRADELLGLAEGSTVTVTGQASKVADIMIIEATGIHVGG
ncbi:MAG: hypothetical protein ACR2NU_12715 [Aeoliella sp.]